LAFHAGAGVARALANGILYTGNELIKTSEMVCIDKRKADMKSSNGRIPWDDMPLVARRSKALRSVRNNYRVPEVIGAVLQWAKCQVAT